MQIDWAVVAATFLGPVLAVLVTLWAQDRSATRQLQMRIFCDMMQWRVDPKQPMFVSALNLVPVYFQGHASIITAYRRLLDTFNDPSWEVLEARQRLNNKVSTDIAGLLHEMSKGLRSEVGYDVISKAAYAPQHWADEVAAQQELRVAFTALLNGQSALPVVVLNQEPDAGHNPE